MLIALLSVFLALTTAFGADTGPFYRGINIRTWKSHQAEWKKPEDWDFSFARIKKLPFGFNAVRIYTARDGDNCEPLPAVFDAAHKHDLDVLLGLYLDDGMTMTEAQVFETSRFAFEFEALKRGLRYAEQIGAIDQVIGISVGNEDLHNHRQTPKMLVKMIKSVQAWLRDEFGDRCIPVGHTDTYSNLVKPESYQELYDASDFLVANSFPFWENVTINAAAERFQSSIATIDYHSKQYGIPIFLGEFGWPTNGEARGEAIPSVENLQQYWRDVVCSEDFQGRDAFFYVDHDDGFRHDGPPFGIFADDGHLKISLACDI